MSAQAIAGWALVALFAVSLLAEALRRRAFRRNHITLSEWLAGMRALPPLPPPTRTQEGAVGGLTADEAEALRREIDQIGRQG